MALSTAHKTLVKPFFHSPVLIVVWQRAFHVFWKADSWHDSCGKGERLQLVPEPPGLANDFGIDVPMEIDPPVGVLV